MMKVWQPVEDGVYGNYDTVSVQENGSIIEVSSAYGNGHKVSAMLPLSDDLRLCRAVDQPDAPAGAGVLTDEVREAMQTLCASVDRNATFALYQAKVIVRAWLAEQEGA